MGRIVLLITLLAVYMVGSGISFAQTTTGARSLRRATEPVWTLAHCPKFKRRTGMLRMNGGSETI